MRIRGVFGLFCVSLVFFIAICESEAKGGRGGGFSRGSGSSRGSSWGGSSKSSGGWFGSSRPSPSYSRPAPSPSYTYSRPSPSYSAPSPSYSAPAPSYSAPAPSYGWNVNSRGTSGSSVGSNSPSYGWNVGGGNSGTGSGSSGGSKPSYGWNVGGGSNTNTAARPSAPVGPPPAYPGLQNRPVQNVNSPPAYSPSYSNPPAYNPSYSPSHYNSPSYGSNTYRSSNSYNTYSSNPGTYYGGGGGGSYYNRERDYGRTFGSAGLGGNTYISNNYYGSGRSSGGSGFLTNALFYGAGTHHGYMWGSRNSYHGSDYYRRREWNEDQDRRWRATTQAPYFANKVPGEDKILPASAVVGAATAFGLISLLPLNVPAEKPLMYCNSTELMQTQIRVENGYTYMCINETIIAVCPKTIDDALASPVNFTDLVIVDQQNEFNATNETESTTTTTTEIPVTSVCRNHLIMCGDNAREGVDGTYCRSASLFSRINMFCNSTSVLNGTNVNETTTILNCYKGELPDSQASFVPTTTQAPTTTTEKSLSLGAKMHIFFLKLVGKSDILEKTTTTTPEPDIPQLADGETPWVPEAITIPTTTTTTTTTTTEAPFKWMQKTRKQFENGTHGTVLEEVPKYLLEAQETALRLAKAIGDKDYDPFRFYVKEYITETSTQANTNSTVSVGEKSEDAILMQTNTTNSTVSEGKNSEDSTTTTSEKPNES